MNPTYEGKYYFCVKGLLTYYVSQNQGFLDPPSVSIWLSPPPPLVSICPTPFSTTIFYVDSFT